MVDPGGYRGLEQILHVGRFARSVVGSVIVSVLAGVEKGGHGAQGGVGDLGVDGDLPAGLVPQDLQVERDEQASLDVRRQAGQDVPDRGEPVEQGRVGGLRGAGGQVGELGLLVLLFVVKLGEPGADPGRYRGGFFMRTRLS